MTRTEAFDKAWRIAFKKRDFSLVKDTEIFVSVTSKITYKDGKIITQSTKREALNYDPSEGQDWNWEDYE